MLTLSHEKEQKKSRNEVELPKIARAQTVEIGTIALRFHWLKQPRDYSRDSLSEIQEEYNKLRKELLGLNEEAALSVERLAAKPSKKLQKSTDMSRLTEICSKQVQNNLAIINRLRAQLEKLQQRLTTVSVTSKDQLDDIISQKREQIGALRHQNKQLKQKSKEIGDNIESSDDIFGEIKRTEMELGVAERKRSKLQAKLKQVCSNLEKLKKGIAEMRGEATSAEHFIEEQLQQSQAEKQEKKQESIYLQKVLGLEVIKKNMESFNTLKQLKYHQTLKQLENITSKLSAEENTINLSEEKELRQKAQLIQLDQQLKKAKQKAKSRASEPISHSLTQQEEKQNEDDEIGNDKIQKITRKKASTKQQLRKSLNVRIEGKESKGRTTELRLNRLTKLKQQKQLNTIDPFTLAEKSEQKNGSAKNSVSYNLNRMNRSYNQQQKQKNTTSYSIQSRTIERRPAGKKEALKNTIFEQKNKDGQEQIQQDICASYLKDETFENKSGNIQAVFVSEPISHQSKSKEKQTKEHPQGEKMEDQREEPQQSDEDIIEFKRSITEQMTNPSAGLRSVDIALGEIQNSIRQHQQRSRMNRYHQERPIDEEQESLH